MEKRESCRAVVFKDNKMVVMHRIKNGREYFTFPGGGKEDGETLEDCVVREVIEEFGITVKPLREIYVYEDIKTLQHYFLCEYVSGEFGTGEGEEFQEVNAENVYEPMLVEVSKLSSIALMPPEITSCLVTDLADNGLEIRKDVKRIVGE